MKPVGMIYIAFALIVNGNDTARFIDSWQMSWIELVFKPILEKTPPPNFSIKLAFQQSCGPSVSSPGWLNSCFDHSNGCWWAVFDINI